MQKLKSVLAVASIIACAVIVFIACGSGELKEIVGDIEKEVDKSLGSGLVDKIKDGDIYENYKPSSSSEEEESSSSEYSGGESSSSQHQVSSSSSVGGGQSSSSSQSSNQSSSSTQKSSSSSAAPKSSSSNAPANTSGCAASNPKQGFTCAWNKTADLLPKDILKPANATIPSGCQVAWKYAKGQGFENKPPLTDMELQFGCELLPESGVEAEGSTIYALFAELTCEGDAAKHTTACEPKGHLPSKIAPYMKDKCVWHRNKTDNEAITTTTTARGAVPTGVNLVDPDKICGTTAPPIVYKNGNDAWVEGPLAKEKAGTYKDVRATVNCPRYPLEPYDACPALEVKPGSDYEITCTGGQISETSCGGTGAWKNVKNNECIDVVINWENKDYLPGIKMICHGSFPQESGTAPTTSISIKVGSKPENTVPGTNSPRNETTLITKLPGVGRQEILAVCVSFKSNQTPPPTVKCELGVL